MTHRPKTAAVVFSIYILLTFYVYGGGIVNSLVAYRTWRAVGANEFPAFHQIDSSLIIPLFVFPIFLSYIPQILLLWFRPMGISRWMIWIVLLLNLIGFISTISIQIPIQMELDKRFSMELIDRLISTDMIYRKIPMTLMTVVNFIMLYKVVRQASFKNSIA